MYDTKFRWITQRFLTQPLAKALLFLWPGTGYGLVNSLTVLSVVLGAFVPLWTVRGRPFLAAGFLLSSGLVDALDGTVARLANASSPEGAALDIFCDRVVESLVILGFLLQIPGSALNTFLMLVSSYLCVTSFLVVSLLETVSGREATVVSGTAPETKAAKTFSYSPGLVERTEAFIFFLVMLFVSETHFRLLALAYSALVSLTALVRMVEFFRASYRKRTAH